MVNYQNPKTITQDFVVLVKFWHVVNGIFIWEFFTTLQLEWNVLRGNRPYKWTIWVYSVARVFTLMSVILNIIGFDTTSPLNCQLWATSLLFFSYFANLASSLLIMLRVIDIWNREKIVFVTAMGIFVADFVLLVNAIARFRSTWSPSTTACLLGKFDSISLKLASVAMLFTDVVLLLIMLIGLLRMRRGSGGTSGVFSLWLFLWRQGLIWILLATIAEVPSVVLMFLDLNAPLNLILQIPCMILLTTAATRMYRTLANFGSSDNRRGSHLGQGGVRAVTDMSSMRVQTGPITLNGMMSVGAESNQFPSSYVSTTTDEGRGKAHEVSLAGAAESNPEK